jgi:hypothetical protein
VLSLLAEATELARFRCQPTLADEDINVAFGRAFAAPAKPFGNLSRRRRWFTRDKFVANELENPALNVG